MKSLIEKHKAEIRFTLRLFDKKSGLFVGAGGLTVRAAAGLEFEAGSEGESVQNLMQFFAKECDIPWLMKFNANEFEIESQLV